MTIVADKRPSAADMLPADNPSAWSDNDMEAVLALSHRDYQPLQVAALRLRFEQLGDSVKALQKLAKRQGVTSVDSITDALPLFFDHRVYKSYPLAIIEQRDLAKLNSWLDRLTTHDLSKMSLEGLTTIDGAAKSDSNPGQFWRTVGADNETGAVMVNVLNDHGSQKELVGAQVGDGRQDDGSEPGRRSADAQRPSNHPPEGAVLRVILSRSGAHVPSRLLRALSAAGLVG